MDPSGHSVFSDLKQDAKAPLAGAFARIVVEYFASTRSGEGRVSTAQGRDDLRLAEMAGRPNAV
jgi:hypothetical protein